MKELRRCYAFAPRNLIRGDLLVGVPLLVLSQPFFLLWFLYCFTVSPKKAFRELIYPDVVMGRYRRRQRYLMGLYYERAKQEKRIAKEQKQREEKKLLRNFKVNVCISEPKGEKRVEYIQREKPLTDEELDLVYRESKPLLDQFKKPIK